MLGVFSAFFSIPEALVPVVWLPAGYTLALLLGGGHKNLPLSIAGSILAAVPFVVLVPGGTPGSLTGDLVILSSYSFMVPLFSWLSYRRLSARISPLSNETRFFSLFAVLSVACLLAAFLPLVDAFWADHPLPGDAIAINFLLNNGLSAFVGTLIVAPATLAISKKALLRPQSGPATEWLAWIFTLALALFFTTREPVPGLFLLLPLMLWAGARFSLPGATLAIALAGVAGLASAFTSLAAAPDGNQLILAQGLVGMMVAASCYSRVLLEDRARVVADLKTLVDTRTLELQSLNSELNDAISRHEAEKSSSQSSRHYRALFETASNPIIFIDKDLLIQQWNGAAETLFGYDREQAVGRCLTDTFIPPEQRDEFGWKILKVMASGAPQDTVETTVPRVAGTSSTILWNLSRVPDDEDDDTSQLILIGQDISEIRHTQDQLHYLAHYDVLTDTANRRLFEDRCRQAITSALRHGYQCAIIGLDVDHFKRINDTLGHDAGDRLLQEMAHRLRNNLREEDTISRLGGDEFAVLLNKVNGTDGCKKVARSLLAAVTEPTDIPGGEIVITSSIGITLAPDDGQSYEQLLKNADMAMYRAKKAGRNTIQFFSPDMNDALLEQMSMERQLREGIREGQLDLHYQPVVDVGTGRIVGLEALLRWHHPSKGLLTPKEFLGVAEHTGQLQVLGEWVCLNACLQARAIQTISGFPVTVSINLSSRQYDHSRLTEQLGQIIDETGLDPALLMVEIDERILSDRLEETPRTLDKLKNLGVGLVLDRFGSGLSSLRLLRDLPFDQVKIDHYLLQQAPADENTAAIVHTLIKLARQLSLRVSAAGIETVEQDAFLRNAGCQLLQGDGYSPPVPSNDLGELFRSLEERPGLLAFDEPVRT
jgi:diguanylate cyclase (GGDEF)-like protein/PAS domain S-box-containing protein